MEIPIGLCSREISIPDESPTVKMFGNVLMSGTLLAKFAGLYAGVTHPDTPISHI